MSSLDTPAVERYAQKLHISPVTSSMVSVDRNPQRNQTSKLRGLKGEETNKLIFRLVSMEEATT